MTNKSKLPLIAAVAAASIAPSSRVWNLSDAPREFGSIMRLAIRDVDVLAAKLPFRFVPKTATR